MDWLDWPYGPYRSDWLDRSHRTDGQYGGHGQYGTYRCYWLDGLYGSDGLDR